MSKYQQKLIDEFGYEPKSFPCLLFKKEICDTLNDLPSSDRAILFTAISNYHWYAIEPSNLSPKQEGVFFSVKRFIDSNIREYIEVCKTKSNNRKNSLIDNN